MKNLLTISLATVTLIVAMTSGCNCAQAGVKSGMSEQDAKNAIANMEPEDKIRAIASSPMSQEKKNEEYAKIEQETGVVAQEVLNPGDGPVPGTGAGVNLKGP